MGAQRWLCRAIAESFSDFRWENKQGIAGEEQRQPHGAGRATLLLFAGSVGQPSGLDASLCAFIMAQQSGFIGGGICARIGTAIRIIERQSATA
jgi:hypothetical protein